MKALKVFFPLVLAALILTGCVGQVMTPYPFVEKESTETAVPAAAETPQATAEAAAPEAFDMELALAGMQKGGCGGCHVIPGVAGATGVLGPDLNRIGAVAAERVQGKGYSGKAKTVQEYMVEALREPDAFLSPDCAGKPCPKGLMPASLTDALSQDELNAVIGFLSALPEAK